MRPTSVRARLPYTSKLLLSDLPQAPMRKGLKADDKNEGINKPENSNI